MATLALQSIRWWLWSGGIPLGIFQTYYQKDKVRKRSMDRRDSNWHHTAMGHPWPSLL